MYSGESEGANSMTLLDLLSAKVQELTEMEQFQLARFIIDELLPPRSHNRGFDLDRLRGEVAELRLLMGLGPIEVKRDYRVSETDRVAIEVECRGRPSGIVTTQAAHWAICLAGEEYKDEVTILIATERLRRIAEGCWLQAGGDDHASQNRLVPTARLVAPVRAIGRWSPKLF